MALENWIKQTTATTGTGTITLGTAVAGFITFGDQYSDGDEVYYTITDGLNRENGLGTYTASGTTLSRDTIFETLVSGTFDNTSPTAISLSGDAVVMVSTTKNGLTTHAPLWKDNLTSFFSAKLPGANAPDLKSFQSGTYAYAFDPATNEEVYLSFHIDHDILQGSTVYPHVHWSPEDTNTGTVRWAFEYTMAARDTGTFGTTTTIYMEQAGSGTAFDHQVVEDATGFTISTPEVDSVLICRVYRDASHVNDTYTGDAFGLFVDIHYQADRIGTPAKAADFYTW